MDKNITVSFSLEKVSEKAEMEVFDKVREIADYFTAIYGATVKLEYSPKKN